MIVTSKMKAMSVAAVLMATSAQASDPVSGMAGAQQDARPVAHQIIAKQILLQSIARDACFRMAGMDSKDFGARVTASLAEMDSAVEGHAGTDALDRFSVQWQTLSPAVQQVVAGDFHAVPIRQVLTLEVAAGSEFATVLDAVDAGTMAQDSDETLHIRTLKEQQLRVQKMTKEACLVSRDIAPVENRANLAQTVGLFMDAHTAITMAATGQERAHLEALSATSRDFSVLLDIILTEGVLPKSAKIRFSMLSDDMMDRLRTLEQEAVSGTENKAGFDLSLF